MIQIHGIRPLTLASCMAALALLAGCASTKQLEELAQRVEAVEADTAAAKQTADEALSEARAAKGLAEDAAQCCVDTNAKIDRLFYRSQMK